MKTFCYSDKTIDLFKLLKHYTPHRILSDGFCEVIFDYANFYIIATPEVYVAASQNKFDEVINAEFKRINSVFEPKKSDLLLFQNNRVSRLWILRTMLYFTDDVVYNSDEAIKNIEIEAETNPILADLMRKSTSGHSEVVCHPQSVEAKSVNKEFANLVDAGIMLQIDNQLLICFSYHNGFGIYGKTMSPDVIEEDVTPFYELIEIV